MGLLDHLWDDTVAGPRPENGLGKLRKHHTFSFRAGSGKESDSGSVKSYGDDSPEDAVKVTRSIMIVKPPGYQSQSGSAPVSPAGSTPPVSPFSGLVMMAVCVLSTHNDQGKGRAQAQCAYPGVS
ncbi:Dormancyauxin associated [Spatholobus suberectus]|nr:Dormancyauxin associated [Spatholobus suberectus]